MTKDGLLQQLRFNVDERLKNYETAVVIHAQAHLAHDVMLMAKPVEKDAAIRRVMAQGQTGFTAYTAAEKLVEDESTYRVFLRGLREADYDRMMKLGVLRVSDFRCQLAIALVAAQEVA